MIIFHLPPVQRRHIYSLFQNDTDRQSTFLNLATFKKILINVINNPKFQLLINEEDHAIIFDFCQMSEAAKAMLVHLSSVKLQWKRVTELKYPEFGTGFDLSLPLGELLEKQFLVDGEGKQVL